MPQPEPFADIKDQATRICDASSFELLSYPITGIGLPLLKMRLPALDAAARPVLLGAGIHGDEPAAVTAVLQFVSSHQWKKYPQLHFTIYPCINPTGYNLGTRENANGDDVNRSFYGKGTPESEAMRSSLDGDAYDFWIDAHEDYAEDGFYMFAPLDGVGASEIVKAVGKVGPITSKAEIDEMRVIDGIVKHEGDIRKRIDARKDWPMAFYLIKKFSERGFTPETPGLQPLKLRVTMQLAAYNSALSQFAKEVTVTGGDVCSR